MKQASQSHRPVIVSFSGIDGAGKSTQIRNLRNFLVDARLSVRTLSFWDDIATFSRLREGMSLRLFKGDPGVGSPEKPVSRRDKNVRSPYLDAVRLGLYFFDTLSLNFATAGLRKTDCDVVLFDRYFFDELANLPLMRPLVRSCIAALMRLCPRPDIAFLLDVDPERARNRKPEYPLNFLRQNRAAYLNLSRLSSMVVISDMPEQEATARIVREFVERTTSRISWCVQPMAG